MQYTKPYTYFLQKPGSGMNLLWGSLALGSTLFIPIIGQLLVFGYQAEVAEDLKRDPDIADHRDFDFNRFVEYLTRGIWPFLAQLIVGLAMLFAIVVVIGVGFATYVASGIDWLGVVIGGLLYIPVMVIGSMVAWPMMLHTQLSKGLHLGPAVRFTRAMLRTVGGQLFVSLVVHMLISIPLTIVGILLCFVGIYPAMMIQFMAQEHYMIQLYRLHLDEGGPPIGSETLEILDDAE